MHDAPTYNGETTDELDFNSCIKIIDDFTRTLDHWGIRGRINLTGGDPLLKENIFEIIKYASKKNILVGILGNPDRINYVTARKLKELGILNYQISIDGMEETHDAFRGKKGAFREVIKAIHILNSVGIESDVMFTVCKANAPELIDVIRLAAREGVSKFHFARLVPTGKGAELKKDMLAPKEYRALLLNILEELKKLEETGCKTKFSRKDHLWTLLYHELGLRKPLPNYREMIYSGCSIGINMMTILADGTVLPCRRLPIIIGKVPQQSLRDIFINSIELNRMREIESLKKCGRCDLIQFCRGCPAVAFGATNDYIGEDPQCWMMI